MIIPALYRYVAGVAVLLAIGLWLHHVVYRAGYQAATAQVRGSRQSRPDQS